MKDYKELKIAIDELIRMLRMRTEDGRKYFVQKEVGRIIGVSRQMINPALAGLQAGGPVGAYCR
jgi:hypothetical protein